MENLDLNVQEYTEKSIVLTGEDTKAYKEELKKIGGRYNPYLKCGPGWIFSKKKEDELKEKIKELEKDNSKKSKIDFKSHCDIFQVFNEIDKLRDRFSELKEENQDEALEYLKQTFELV